MRSLYTRPQRLSIYHPATIGDIPQEVLQKAFLSLGRMDLLSASSACRAFRPVAQEIIFSRVKIDRQLAHSNWLCGVRLNLLVFGQSSFFQISALSLIVGVIRKEFIPLIAKIVAPNLTSLDINFSYISPRVVLEIFLSRCEGVRNLRLKLCIFEAHLFSSLFIREGFGRLKQLDLISCAGQVENARIFTESTPISSLKSFRFFSMRNATVGEQIEAVNSSLMNLGNSLIRLDLDCFVSCANIITIADRFPCLVYLRISFTQKGEELTFPAIEAISSLPHLKRLIIGDFNQRHKCVIADGALSALARCYDLKHLCLQFVRLAILRWILRGVGGNFVSLVLKSANFRGILLSLESKLFFAKGFFGEEGLLSRLLRSFVFLVGMA
jgi:hypothetical protein